MAKNPYEVLGISPASTDEEVKKAYHDLVKKYHPDRYKDNPLEDLAKEKMQEVNEAYESIKAIRSGEGSGAGYGGQTGAGGPQGPTDEYGRPRNYGYGGSPYRGPYYSGGTSGCGDPCQSLSCLCCADSCCECMGGDLCSCC